MSYLVRAAIAFIAIITVACSSYTECLKGVTVQNFSITLDKGMCFGTCPVFSGSIMGDRNVIYNGIRFTDREGTYRGMISESELCDLVTEIRSNNVMSLDTNYRDNVADAPESELRIVYEGKVKTIKWNMGAPASLKKLEALIVKHTHENGALKKF